MRSRVIVGAAILAISVGCSRSQKTADTSEAKPSASPGGTAAKASPAGSAQAAQGAQQIAQGMQQLTQGLQQMSNSAAKPVDSDELKALLPDLSGWTKSDVKGEMVSLGVSQSNASAKYTKGASAIELTITDAAGNQLFLAPLSMFMAAGYNEKTDDGYKRAIQVSGNPGFEEFEKSAKHGEATAIIANRFVVSAEAHGVDSPDLARQAVEAVDLAKLAGIK